MKTTNTLLLSLGILICSLNAWSQIGSTSGGVKKQKHVSTSSGIEGNIFQFAQLTDQGISKRTIPRYSYFFNTGVDFNIHAHDYVKIFTGINLKNLGIIQKVDSIKTKRRVYSLGVPLGLKFQLIKDELALKIGGDYNLAFNYKEKVFVNGNKESKFNEFFSERTPQFFPSIFAGLNYLGYSISVYYYPQNFFNQDYIGAGGIKPYQNLDAKMFTLSVGFNMDGKTAKKNNFKFKKKNKSTDYSE